MFIFSFKQIFVLPNYLIVIINATFNEKVCFYSVFDRFNCPSHIFAFSNGGRQDVSVILDDQIDTSVTLQYPPLVSSLSLSRFE